VIKGGTMVFNKRYEVLNEWRTLGGRI